MEGKLFYIKCKKKRYNNENGGRKMKRRKITALLMASAMALTAFVNRITELEGVGNATLVSYNGEYMG